MTPSTQNEWERQVGENLCQDCSRPFEDWYTEGITWNKVVGGYNGILCTYCFLKRAFSSMTARWYLTPLSFEGAPDSPDVQVRQGEVERIYKILEEERQAFTTTRRDAIEECLEVLPDDAKFNHGDDGCNECCSAGGYNIALSEIRTALEKLL